MTFDALTACVCEPPLTHAGSPGKSTSGKRSLSETAALLNGRGFSHIAIFVREWTALAAQMYMELGLSRAELDEYFVGPAFLAWHRMVPHHTALLHRTAGRCAPRLQ
jgi:hypothetical protein